MRSVPRSATVGHFRNDYAFCDVALHCLIESSLAFSNWLAQAITRAPEN